MNKFKLSLFLTVMLMLMLGVGKTWGQTTASIDFSAQGYTNAQEITDAVIDGNVSVAFYKGSNSNTPKYYTSGTAIRCYGGNYFTITSAEGNLTAITLTFGSGDGSNAITTNVGSFTSPTWTGDSPSVTFTIGGTTGNRRIKGISVTYASSTPTCATPTFAPEGGTYTEAQTVSISCETEGASIHYTLDGTAPTASSALYTAPVAIATTTTLKAIAVKEGNADSEVASATYTINLPTYTFNKIYAHSAVTATDTYMIVDVNSGKALTWANGTSSAPTAVPVTINGEQIVTDNTNLFWNIQSTGEGYVINPVGDDTRWLYSTNANNGVRVGTNDNKHWTFDVTSEETPNYHGFKHNATGRFMGVYNNQDWRTYTSIINNIKDTQIEIFVLGPAPVPPGDPELTVTPTVIEPFSYEQGAGPSTAKTFTVSGVDLKGDITLTAPQNFEIANGGTYSSGITLSPASGVVAETTISVRMVAGLLLNTYSGDLVIATSDATPITLALSGEVTISNTVATPTFSPAAGSYLTPQSVVIATETAGATIHYTTDGSEPTVESPVYTAPFIVNSNMTLKALGVKENYHNSAIAEAEYTFPTLLSIAEARALNANEYAMVEGIVTFIDGRNVYVQDATAGIVLYLNNNTIPSNLAIGDEVRAYGKRTTYSGLVELTGIKGNSVSEFVVISSGNELPLAVKTIEEINSDYSGSNLLQSTRVKIETAIIGAINTSGNTVIRQDNNTMNVYRIPAVEGMVQGDWVTITGIIGCYNAPQLRVVSADDVDYTHRPTLVANPTTVSGMHYQHGQGPSEIAGFILEGHYLEGDVFIHGSENFELSTTSGVLFNPENPIRIIPPHSGHFQGFKVYCRLKSGLEVGTYNEVQHITTLDGDTLQVRLIGNVTDGGGGSDQYVRISELSTLTEGSKVVFAARFDENETEYYAMHNASSGKPTGVLFTSATAQGDEILPESIIAEEDSFYWTVGLDNGNYTFTNANGDMIGYNSSTNFTTGGDNTAWSIEAGTSDPASMVPNYSAFLIKNINVDNRAFALNTSHNFGPYAIANLNSASYNFFIDLFVKSEGGTPVVATPTFTPTAGTYYEPQTVTIACGTADATIHYTLDGSEPSATSPVYTEALSITETTTVKAIAMKDGYDDSAIATATYTIQTGVVAIFNQDWEGAMNGWTFVTVSGQTQWSVASYGNNHYALVNGYNKPASEAWCISPAFNLNNYDNPVLSFKTAKNYEGADIEVFFSNDYDGINPATATWQPLTCALSEGSWNWVESGDIDLSAYNGTNCYIGYKYTNTDDTAAGWELDDCLLVANTTNPVVTATPLTLNGFSYYFEEGPSAEQTFVVSGMNLTNDITISEATDYEISSTSGEAFVSQATITLTPVNGNVAETTIYVRLKAGLAIGDYNDETITIASVGANTLNLTCNGSVMEPGGEGGDYVRIADAGILADGNRVILAARYDTNATHYLAIANTLTSGKPSTTEFISTTNENGEVVPADILNNENAYYWTVNTTDNGYTFTNVNGQIIGYNSGTNFNMDGDKTEWIIAMGTADPTALVPSYEGFTIINANTTNRAFAVNDSHVCGAYSTSNMTGGNAPTYNFYLDIFMQGEGGTPTVAAPTFTPAAGTYYEAQEVSIACSTADADIYYSLESEEGPWTAYTQAIAVTESTTIWAYAEKADYNDSPVVSATYTIQDDIVVIFNQDWENDWNGWTEVSVEGDMVWEIRDYSNNHYAYANGYNMGANEDWLISPAFNLDAYSDVVLNFRSAMNYTGPDVEVYFSNDYDGQDPSTANWQVLSCDLSQGSWTWTESGAISLDAFSGSNCHIAFKYTSTETEAAGWEIDDIILSSGTSTEPVITATPNALNGLTYLYQQGPSESVSYQLNAANLVGEGELMVLVTEGFEISLDDEEFDEELAIAYTDGSLIDQPVTVYVRLAEGLEIGTYEGVIMHEGGEAYAEVNLSGEVQSAEQPAIDAFMPLYVQGNNGTNNNRVPIAIAVYLENLEPSTTYRYTNQFVDANDGPTVAGAGNVIYANENGFYRTTSPSLSTEGSYGEFTTDATGEAFAWFINEPTANTRFTPGNQVYLRIRINDGHDGTDVAQTFTTEDYATVLSFGTEHDAYQGTAFYAQSEESPMSFAMMFSSDDDIRPTYSTPIETTGVDYGSINQYANFYKEEVAGKDGFFGGILPNDNEDGINIIWILDLESYVINDYYAEGGEWATAQTANPQGGLDDIIFIDLTDDGVTETTEDENVTIWNTRNEIVVENQGLNAYEMVVCNLLGQPVMSSRVDAGSSQRYSHHLSEGLYIVTLRNNSAVISKKIIVR